MQRILVPIDFGEKCGHALRFAHSIAQEKGWRLTLFHVYPTLPSQRKIQISSSEMEYNREIRKKVADFGNKWLGALPKNTLIIARNGTPWAKICQISKAYVLIVVGGNHYRSGIHRWIGGHTSIITLNAHCPVLVVPIGAIYKGINDVWVLGRKSEDKQVSEKVMEMLGLQNVHLNLKEFPELRILPSLWDPFRRRQSNSESKLDKMIQSYLAEKNIDLIVLINYNRGNLEKFLNDETKQILFKYRLPTLVCQAKNVFPEQFSEKPKEYRLF